MPIDFKLDFYEVKKCGFYKRAATNPEFGDLSTLVEDLTNFLDGKPLNLTKTYDYDDDSGQLPTYCYDFVGEGDNFILITWNETPFEEGSVSSANGNDFVGEVSIELTSVPENHIPGYATYFWIIPSRDLIVSIRPVGMAFNGHQNLKKYFQNFLRYYSRYNILDPNDPDTIIGYSNVSDSDGTFYPKFETFLKKRPTDIDYLLNNANEIYKLIKKDKLHLEAEVQLSFLDSILYKLCLSDVDPTILEEKSYKIELEYTPNTDDIRKIIDDFDNSTYDPSIDFGFQLHGRPSPIWLSKTYEKHEFTFFVEREPGAVINANELFQQIVLNRENLLNILEV